MAHTPGPWERVDTADYAEIHPKGRRHLSPIALVGNPDDADLVANSPYLLEAVSELVEQWDAFEASNGNMGEAYYKLAKYARPSWEKARAAIAKATTNA